MKIEIEIEIVPPLQSGDNVVRFYQNGDFLGRETQIINKLIYSVTGLNWYEEEKNRTDKYKEKD